MATVRIEDVKAAGIAVDVDRFAADGFTAISEEDRYRLKTQGICAQRHVGVFMLRIRVPGGKATSAQLRRVADLADAYGHAGVHITTRGGLELHHVKIESVPAVWAGLAEVDLTTKGACGDTVRNVIACAHAGTYAGEVLPPAPFVQLLHERIVAQSDATNISRKMNPAFACSPNCDDHVATSDIGFVATPDPDGGEPTFTVWGAGGLGATPRLAIELRAGVPQCDLLPAFDAIVALGAKYADRSSRAKAKIKLLVDKLGRERVIELFDEEFAAAKAREAYASLTFSATDHPTRAQPVPAHATDVVEQKQLGRYTIPALVPMGELTSNAARSLAAAAERFGDGVVHLTPDQNAELHDVAGADLDAARAALTTLGLRTSGRGGIADVVSCVGLEYCPLAVAHSMTMGEEIALAFDGLRTRPRYADFRIHVSGCPHSCAKHQVADIGLAGAVMEYDGERVEAYAMYIGGNARERRLGTMHAKKIPRKLVIPVIAALLDMYEDVARDDERFSVALARIGTEATATVVTSVLDAKHIAMPAMHSAPRASERARS